MGRGVHTEPDFRPADPLAAPPPGVVWGMVAPHDDTKMVLPVDGRRSICAPWPPGSFCESCGEHADGGYVGPAVGQRVYFPSPLLHRVCVRCARASLGLAGDELTGHTCCIRCSDRLHMELADPDGQRPAELRRRGWRIADITAPPAPWADMDGVRALWMEPARLLPWPTAVADHDPWIV